MLIEDQIFEKGKKSIILCEDDRTALDVEKVLKSKGLKLGKVVKKPIDGLVSYHLSIA